MAICDAKTVFANNYNMSGHVTAGSTYVMGSTAWSGAIANGGVQIVDQEKAGDAVGQELTLKAVAAADIVGASSTTTVQVKFETSDAIDSGWTELVSGPKYPVGTKCLAGTSLFECRIPAGAKRYLRASYTVGTANVTSGCISVYATRDL